MSTIEFTAEEPAAGWKHRKTQTKGRKPQFGKAPAPNFTKNGSKHHCPYCGSSLTLKQNGVYQQVIKCAKSGHIRPCPDHQAPCFIAWPAGDKCPATKEREKAELALTDKQNAERDREHMQSMLQKAEDRNDHLSVWRYRAALDEQYKLFCNRPFKYLAQYFARYMASGKVAQAEARKVDLILKDLMKEAAAQVELASETSEAESQIQKELVYTLAMDQADVVNSGASAAIEPAREADVASFDPRRGNEISVKSRAEELLPSDAHIVEEIDADMPAKRPVTTNNSFSILGRLRRAGTIKVVEREQASPAKVVARKPPQAKMGEWTEVKSFAKGLAKKRQKTVTGLDAQPARTGKVATLGSPSVNHRHSKTTSMNANATVKLNVLKRK